MGGVGGLGSTVEWVCWWFLGGVWVFFGGCGSVCVGGGGGWGGVGGGGGGMLVGGWGGVAGWGKARV